MTKKSTATEKRESLYKGVRIIDYKGQKRYEYRFSYEGVRYSTYGRTQREALDKGDEKRSALKAGTYRKNNSVTLAEYFEEWKAQKAQTVKANTIGTYEKRFNLYVRKRLGRYKVKDIERRQVINAMNSIAASVSVNAANKCRVLLAEILKSAMYDGIAATNVAKTVPNMKDNKPAARETIHRALTDEEIQAFMGAAKGHWYYTALRFILATGVRAGECAGLQWNDIDTKNGVIHIRRTVTRDRNCKNVLGDSPKTAKSRRDIPLNAEISAILDIQKEQYAALFGNTIAIHGLIFVNSDGGMIHPCNFNAVISRIVDKYNADNEKKADGERGAVLKRFSVHAFRDTFASKAAADGVPLNVLKELMGHSSYAMTADLYGHIYDEQKKKAMKGLQMVITG